MAGRKSEVGLWMLVALIALAAVGAQSAVASEGTTVFTCKKKGSPGGVGFSKAHCKAADAVASSAEYEHVEAPEQVFTGVKISNEDTTGAKVPVKIATTIAGIPLEIQATEVAGEGSGEDSLTPTGEHFLHGQVGGITYSNLTVLKPPLKKEEIKGKEVITECKVKGGKIVSQPLQWSSAGQNAKVVITTEKSLYATFEIEGCPEEVASVINGSYELKEGKGSGLATCALDGATFSCTHAITTENFGFTLRGQNAGIDSTLTLSGKASGDPAYTPVGATKVVPGTSKGTTAFTCRKHEAVGGSGFTKAHCKAEDATEAGAEFEHVAVPEGATTEARGTNEGTAGEKQTTRLQSTISGVNVELQTTEVTTEGWLEDLKGEDGEHFIHGENQITYGNVTVTAPKEKGCKVKGAKITTNLLRFSTARRGMAGRVEAASGETLSSFNIEGCTVAALNGVYEVKGSITCPLDGATVTCAEKATTEQATLKMRAQKIGIEGASTVSARNPALGETTYTPLSETTVETP